MPNSCLTNCCGEGNSLPCLRPKFCRMGPREERPSGFLITCNRYHRSETSDQQGRCIILVRETAYRLRMHYTSSRGHVPAREQVHHDHTKRASMTIVPAGSAQHDYSGNGLHHNHASRGCINSAFLRLFTFGSDRVSSLMSMPHFLTCSFNSWRICCAAILRAWERLPCKLGSQVQIPM